MIKAKLALLMALMTFLTLPLRGATENRNTDWFRDARYGVFMHFLPSDDATFALVNKFDVEAVVKQLEEAGAGYFVVTLGQNSGYYNAPNATYEKYAGYQAGERCAKRDLPLALYPVLKQKNIKLMLYLPCQVPNQDSKAQKAFGLRQGQADQPLDLAFAQKWAEVIQEWADRYGDKVAGWWFDGGYEHIKFDEAIAEVYAKPVKHGNPKAIVTFNPGVKVIRYTKAEDYTAGELNEPFGEFPSNRWLRGSQWHALTFLGATWGQRNVRFPTERWTEWIKTVNAKGGVVTLDCGPNYDVAQGPIGTISDQQLLQLKQIRTAVRGR